MIEKLTKLQNKLTQYSNIWWVLGLSLIFTYGLMYRAIEPRTGFIFLAPICLLLLIGRQLNPFDLPFLFLFGAVNFLAVYEYRADPMLRLEYTELVYLWIFPTVFIFGKLMVGEGHDTVRRAEIAIFSLGIGMFIQAFLDYYAQYTVYTEEEGHAWNSFWNHAQSEVRNTFDLGFIVISASFFYLFLKRKSHKRLLIVLLLAEAAALVLNVINQGRTNIVMLVGIFAFCSLIYSILNWKSFSKKVKKLLLFIDSIAVISMSTFTILINKGMIDSGLDENDKFWARGGGVFNNIRIGMAREGLIKAFKYGKGGWAATAGDSNTTHNAFLEYARHYDVVIFFLITLFAITALAISVITLIKNEKDNHILYLTTGTQLALFIYFIMEPNGYAQKKFFLIYLFVTGVSMGCVDNIRKTKTDRPIFADLGLLFLGYAFLNQIYIDYWCDRLAIGVMLIPILAYLIGINFSNLKYIPVVLAIVCFVIAVTTWYISKGTEFWMGGYVIEPLTGAVLKKVYLFGLAIPFLSICCGIIAKKLKAGVPGAVFGSILLAVLYYRERIKDGRLENIKEALNLWWQHPWGTFTVTSSERLSSHTLWLDYARDYGVLVTVPLLIFIFICFIKCIRLMASKEGKSWLDYTLVSSFILFNIYFAVESVPYERKYIFYIALIFWGMLNG